jgi:hypothetical protein
MHETRVTKRANKVGGGGWGRAIERKQHVNGPAAKDVSVCVDGRADWNECGLWTGATTVITDVHLSELSRQYSNQFIY